MQLLQDMPFSGLVMENGTWVGKGYAFYLFELLRSKLNFTYTIVPPKKHVLSINQSGILSLLYEKVRHLRSIALAEIDYVYFNFFASHAS